MLNQRQIKDLVFDTVTAAEAAGRPGEVCYCSETETFYEYVAAGSAYTVDDLGVLSTVNGGDTRWIARAGTYFLERILGVNSIGTPGTVGFGVGICPPHLLPAGMIPLDGCNDRASANYGNYMYSDGSIMCWIPRFYYKISTNLVSIAGIYTYATEAAANVDGYAMHRAFIDGGIDQQGFFVDKYMCSKNALGTGYVASSIKNGLPLSTAAAHNPIADLTACAGNYYYECITAAHARDGVNGAVNASSIFHCGSKFQYAALALLSLAHGQAVSSTAYCAWYGPTYNYPKGCNNDALKDYDEVTNGAGSGVQLLYTTDGYSNCGKTGSGVPFAKSTHNGQNCGVADLNGLMYEVSIGMTCIAPAAAAIEAMSQASPCQITWTGHGMSTGDWVMILAITQADWVGAKDKLWKITRVDDNNFTIPFNASGFGTPYDAGTDPGTVTKGIFYVAKEATAMKAFTSGNGAATDHWGATGVAAMMDAITMASLPFEPGGAFAQRMGSGANQVLDEAISGDGWILTGLGFPQDADGIDTTGTNQFGKDYFYQYIRNELCVRSCDGWDDASGAGVWYVLLNHHRAVADYAVGFRAACYPE